VDRINTASPPSRTNGGRGYRTKELVYHSSKHPTGERKHHSSYIQVFGANLGVTF
jgi:hypothetical protein